MKKGSIVRLSKKIKSLSQISSKKEKARNSLCHNFYKVQFLEWICLRKGSILVGIWKKKSSLLESYSQRGFNSLSQITKEVSILRVIFKKLKFWVTIKKKKKFNSLNQTKSSILWVILKKGSILWVILKNLSHFAKFDFGVNWKIISSNHFFKKV